MAKPSPFSVQGGISKFSQFMAATNTDKFILLTDSDVQNFLEAEENQNMFRKIKKLHTWLW